MAEFPALPLWTDAYLGDTSHLTTIEHGAYLLLLITMWRNKGSLPNDDKLLARYARLTPGQWRRIKPVIWPFFRVENDSITQGRLTDELNAVRQRSESGKANANARWLKTKETGNANASNSDCVGNASISIPRREEKKEDDTRLGPQSLYEKFHDVWGDWIEDHPHASATIPQLLREWQELGLEEDEIIEIAVEARRRKAEPRAAAFFDHIMQRAANAKAGMPGLAPTKRQRPPKLVPLSAMIAKRVG